MIKSRRCGVNGRCHAVSVEMRRLGRYGAIPIKLGTDSGLRRRPWKHQSVRMFGTGSTPLSIEVSRETVEGRTVPRKAPGMA